MRANSDFGSTPSEVAAMVRKVAAPSIHDHVGAT